MSNLNKLLIANRGEIAIRITRAAQELGLTAVAIYPEDDAQSLHVRLADEAILLQGRGASAYLDIAQIVQLAKDAGCDGVHPGYGFLSENANFAAAVEAANMTFIGPSVAALDAFGDKAKARALAQACDVPVVAGLSEAISIEQAQAFFAAHADSGILLKAIAGGGGRGMRIVRSADDLAEAFVRCQSEALAAFGNDGLYAEQLVASPRHIEVQILGDGTDAIHCYERECSLQRRRQKVWEEAGAVCLDKETRETLCNSAVALAKSVNYCGAGTLEYLYDEATNEFFFIEMNTRIQVEHPISEMITGVDLVQEMIRVCGGAKLSLTQDQIHRNGHAIEVRINAEDPLMRFMPWPGKLEKMSVPRGEGIRFDHFLYEGYQIPTFYDSLLGKVIVHAPTRAEAITKLKSVLELIKLKGLKTTISLHLALANDASVQEGAFHTQWLEPWLEAGNLTLAQTKRGER